jgi:hypothetical protein
LRDEVYSRLVTLTRVWPSITPWNVWDLRLGEWRAYAHSVDEYIKSMKER